MEQKELSIALREMACCQKTPLCAEWTKAWKDNTNIDGLLDKYIKGIDFCIKNDYPPLDFCRENFEKEDLHRHNIYLDEYVEIADASSGVWVFVGDCEGEITFRDFSVGTIYLRHGSKIKVRTLGMSKVFVSLYDESEVEVEKLEYSTIKLYDRHNK